MHCAFGVGVMKRTEFITTCLLVVVHVITHLLIRYPCKN